MKLVPAGAAYEALADDYWKMAEDGILLHDAQDFRALMDECAKIEQLINHALK